MTTPHGLEHRLEHFRHAFDQAFAAAPTGTVETFEDLLAVRVAGDRYALRAGEIRGLVVSRRIVPLPSRRPELLGVAGHRGMLVPVYSLAALLGYGAGLTATPWLALVGGSEPLGLGFEQFEGFLRVRSGDIRTARDPGRATPHAGQVVLVDNQSRQVVDIPKALGQLAVRAGTAPSLKES